MAEPIKGGTPMASREYAALLELLGHARMRKSARGDVECLPGQADKRLRREIKEWRSDIETACETIAWELSELSGCGGITSQRERLECIAVAQLDLLLTLAECAVALGVPLDSEWVKGAARRRAPHLRRKHD